jgi:hypothetical protein
LIQYALMDVLDLATPNELYQAELSEEYIVELLIDYDFSRTPFPRGALVPRQEAQPEPFVAELLVKQDGRVYQVHKNDVDPLPSRPHAHDDLNRKIDLSTGDVYVNGRIIDRLKEKKLRELRQRLRDRNQAWLVLPPLIRTR